MGRIQKAPKSNERRTRIRDYGDRKTIVLYTEEDIIYQTLKDKALEEVRYEIWKNCSPDGARFVAVDLYFSKASKTTVEKLIIQLQKSGGNFTKTKSCQRMLKSIKEDRS